ncbi:MAG: hypothetical protein R3A48_01600 [Polyangiales bacterium]
MRRLLPAFALLLGCTSDPLVSQGDASTSDVSTDAPWPVSEPGRHAVTVLETRQVIPGEGLPPETPAGNSNNNLDVARHDGRIYLAWRTAPDHFASSETRLFVVSSADERSWRYETRLSLDRDLREPRFLAWNGRLLLYVSRLGTDPMRFEPQGVSVSERLPDGSWTALEDIRLPGAVAWRTRVERGTPYMLAYRGGENIYLFNNLPLDVDLLTTADGRAWTPLDPAMRAVYHGGGSEADFALGDDGALFAVIRNEAGDDTGWGSLVCRADANALSRWRCRNDPKKYDSPLMFWHDGEAYLVARRNVTADGAYDGQRRGLNRTAQSVQYQLAYGNTPKRCALWRYVQFEDRVAWVLDLPSRGDTCFPAVIAGANPDERVIYDYSSPIDGDDVSWRVGQRGPTRIYRHVLRFARR